MMNRIVEKYCSIYKYMKKYQQVLVEQMYNNTKYMYDTIQ